MSGHIDAERILDAFLAPATDRLPDRVLDAALADIARTPQRLALRVPWRFRQMPTYLRLAAGIAIVAILGVGALSLSNRGPDLGGPPTPTPVQTTSPVPSPTAGSAATLVPIDPGTWIPYTSERFGYTLGRPADSTIRPSGFDWPAGTIHSEISEFPDEIDDAQGGFAARGSTIYAARQDLEPGQTAESWTAEYISNKAGDAAGVCGDISTNRYDPVEVDGETGSRIAMVCAGTTFYTAAIVVHDGSAYLVALATPADSGNAGAIELFDAILASFRFAPTPIDTATWVPYTSARYGYTLDHPADWTIKPSQFDWQPGAIHHEFSEWADEISDPDGGIAARGQTIFVARQDLEAGQTPEAWTARYIDRKALDAGGGCGDISADAHAPVEIDGETGQRIDMVCSGPGSPAAFYTAAIVVHDGSAYLVALATIADSGNPEAVELFDAILAGFRFASS